jgi:hypothetical protein
MIIPEKEKEFCDRKLKMTRKQEFIEGERVIVTMPVRGNGGYHGCPFEATLGCYDESTETYLLKSTTPKQGLGKCLQWSEDHYRIIQFGNWNKSNGTVGVVISNSEELSDLSRFANAECNSIIELANKGSEIDRATVLTTLRELRKQLS